ncbi:hypothetical protein NQD34_009978 [Periophthalmus magnuspinnatus]|nr:hypothetical protein NQD34_009978 [Periophthalmus magnuspinnatus]
MCPVLRSRTRKYFTHVSCAQVYNQEVLHTCILCSGLEPGSTSHMCPVAQRIDFKAALCEQVSPWTSTKEHLPHEPHEPSHTLRTSGTGLLLVPRVRTKHGESVFQFYANKTWTSLPEDVTQASTLTMFKSRFKTGFF